MRITSRTRTYQKKWKTNIKHQKKTDRYNTQNNKHDKKHNSQRTINITTTIMLKPKSNKQNK